jgi:hypothetical protein
VTVEAIEANEIDPAELASATGLDPAIVQSRLDLLEQFGVTDPAEVLAILIGLGAAAPAPESIRDLFPLLPPEGEDPELDAAIARLDSESLQEFLDTGQVTVTSDEQRADLLLFTSVLTGSAADPAADGGLRDLDDDQLGQLATGTLGAGQAGRQLATDVQAAVGPVPDRDDYPPGPEGDQAYLEDFEQNRRDAIADGRNVVGPVDSEDSTVYGILGSPHGAQEFGFGHDVQASQAEVQNRNDPGYISFDVANGVTAVTGYAATLATAPAISAFNAVFGTEIDPATVGLAVADLTWGAFGYDVEAPPLGDSGDADGGNPFGGDLDGDNVPDSYDPDPNDPDVGLPEGEFGGVPDRDGDGVPDYGDPAPDDPNVGITDPDPADPDLPEDPVDDTDGGGGDHQHDDGDRDGDNVPDSYDPDPDDPDVGLPEGEFGGSPTDGGSDNGGGDSDSNYDGGSDRDDRDRDDRDDRGYSGSDRDDRVYSGSDGDPDAGYSSPF